MSFTQCRLVSVRMNRDAELQILAKLSKAMAVMCLRNLEVFESIQRGIPPGENGGDKLVHGSGGISQPRAE